MGCGGSKEDKDDNKIDSEFETVNIKRFDDLFSSASCLLENAEKIRCGVGESKERGSELSHTYKLKEPKYIDVVQILFWTLSAEAEGKIDKTGVTVGSELPFIKLQKGKVSDETFELYETFSTYVKTVVEGPLTLKEIVEKLDELAKQVPEVAENAKNDIKNSSLGMSEKAKAIAKIGKNANKLPKELKKCKELQDLIKQASTDVQELVPKLKGLHDTADETGCKASAEGLKRPGEIFDKYNTSPIDPNKKPPGKKEEKKGEKKGEKKEEKKEEKKAVEK